MGSSQQFISHGLKNKEPNQHVLRDINKLTLSRIHLFSCMATLLSQKIYSPIFNRCPFIRWKIDSFRGGWCPRPKPKSWKLCLGQQCMILRGRESPEEIQDTGGKYKWRFKTFLRISRSILLLRIWLSLLQIIESRIISSLYCSYL